MVKRLYEVLGLPETATHQEISRGYRKMSLKYHPDKHINSTDEQKKLAEKKFSDLTLVKDILLDEEKRVQYDAGKITEKGEPIEAQQAPRQQAPRPDAARRQATPQQQGHHFPENQTQFFKPQPTHYFFFNSVNDANSFRQHQVNGAHFIYMTRSPLRVLFDKMNAGLRQHQETNSSRSEHTSHREANGYSSTYHKPTRNFPEHVSVRTHYPQRMEMVIDRLVAQFVFLTLLENLSKGYEGPEPDSPRPTPGR